MSTTPCGAHHCILLVLVKSSSSEVYEIHKVVPSTTVAE
jgi:hypothetical protein